MIPEQSSCENVTGISCNRTGKWTVIKVWIGRDTLFVSVLRKFGHQVHAERAIG